MAGMKSAIPLTLAVAILAAIGLSSGCALDEMLTVDVPKQTRDHFADELGVDVPAEVTLRQARQLREQGDDTFKRRAEDLAEQHRLSNVLLDTEINDAAFAEQLIGSTVNTGIDMGVPYLENLPMGGVAVGLLAALGGWFAPRPGDAKRLRKEKEDSFNAGQKKAAEIQNQGSNQ